MERGIDIDQTLNAEAEVGGEFQVFNWREKIGR
jgi:hypothetical protein